MEKTGRKKYSICLMTVFVMLFLMLSVSITAHAVDKDRTSYYRKNYTLTGNKASDMVAIALAQKGANYKSAYDPDPWCCYYVSDVARLAGCSNAIPGDGYCGTVYNNILRAGGQKVTSPRAGDIVFYYCNACSGCCGAPWVHIGIMTNSTQSVEGNYNGVVSYPVTGYSHHNGSHSTYNGRITRLYLRPNYGGSSDNNNFKEDAKYNAVKGFRGYTCVTGNAELRQSDLVTRIGDIYPTDECTVHELYTNGWCKVTCPWNDGGTRTGYTKISNFIQTPTAAMENYTSSDYINLYSKANLAAQIYRIYPGDKCLTIGTSGSATQVFMPMSGKGYYELGWAKLTSPEVLKRDTRYPVNFKCRILSDSNSAVSAYQYVNSGYVGHVYVDDDCVIQEVYTNGWCKFSCPFYGKVQTVYGKFSDFSACNIEPYSLKAPKYAETWYKSNKAAKVGWVDVGDDITVIAKSGNVSQIIYPADVGKRCGWIDTSALTVQYTVKYDANGGTGTPSSQTAEIGTEITLPVPGSAGPKRTGYTFAGWTDAQGKALYAGGSRYRGSGNITLYAVWRQNSYYIRYVAGSGEDVPEIQEQKYGDAVKAAGSPGSMLQQIYVMNGIGECREEDTVTLERAFLSWNTKEDGSGTEVKAGADYTPNKDVTLYAQYKKASFTSETLPKAPDRTGYIFAGWYDAEKDGRKVEAGKEISIELSGIYAYWTAKTYTVTYDANGGNGAPEAQTKTFAENLTLSKDEPAREGYTFKGWALEADSKEAAYESGGEYKENEDATLYAVWDEVKADLTGIAVSKQPDKTTYEYGEELNTDGLELELTYSDGRIETVTSGYTVSGYDGKKAGTQTLTVAYGGQTANFDVMVKEQPEDNIAVVTFGDVAGAAPGEEIQMDIQFTKNPGFSFMMLRLSYDTEVLEFVSAENKTEGNHLYVTENVIMWDSGKDVTVGAATQESMGTVVFRVKPNISLTDGQAQTNVGIKSLSCYNEKEEEVALKAVEGIVYVDTVAYGDVNGDGEINAEDVQAIREIVAKELEYKKEADVNGDGIIDGRDIIRLNRYLDDHSVKLGYDPSKAIGSNGENVFNNDIKLSVADVSEVKDHVVTMKIRMDENPGVASLSIYMDYDQNIMELVGAENGEVISGTLAQDQENEALLIWTTDKVAKDPGMLASLTFRLKDEAEAGEYPVAAIVSECYDKSEKSHFGMSGEGYILVPMGRVEAEDVMLDPAELTLEGGDAAELTANVTPLDATDKTVTWKSSDEKVAVVSGDGQVRALKKGTARVTASIQGKTAECVVTVTSDAPEDDRINTSVPDDTKKEDVPVANVTYKLRTETSSAKIAAGKKVKMKLTGSDGRTLDNSKLTWTSSNSKVASVDSKGTVRFKKKTGGKKVVITAVMKDGSGRSWKFTLRSMKGSVKSVKISGKKTVKAGKSIKLKAIVKTTKGSANKKVAWTSGNTKLAKVSSSGKVTAVKKAKGKVKITAKATDGSGKKKTVTITVK